MEELLYVYMIYLRVNSGVGFYEWNRFAYKVLFMKRDIMYPGLNHNHMQYTYHVKNLNH